MKAGHLYFLSVYTIVMLLDSITTNLVGIMNELLSNPGWAAFDQEYKLDITERWLETEESFNVSDLIAISPNGRITTNENVKFKIRLAHQLLSCKFAKKLNEYCETVRGVGAYCAITVIPSDQLKCLKDFIWIVRQTDDILLRMRGALYCLYQLDPQILFNTDIPEILDDFKSYYSTLNVTKPDNASTIEKILAIEENISQIERRLSIFYGSFCGPVPISETFHGTSSTAGNIANPGTPFPAMMPTLRRNVSTVIKEFIESFDKPYGFNYDMDLFTTQIIYDPVTIQLANQINMLLENPGWSSFRRFMHIKGPFRRPLLETIEILATNHDGMIVTKDNVKEKIQHSHQLLCCQYALVLKKLFDFVRFVWLHCKGMNNHEECWKQFCIKNKQSDRLFRRMKGALSYLYDLLPHNMRYHRVIHNILDDYKLYVELTTEQTMVLRVLIESGYWPSEVGVLDELIKRLKIFYRSHCFPENWIEEVVLIDTSNYTIERLGEMFVNNINSYIEPNYTALGFIFDSTSNTTRTLQCSD